MMKPLGLLALLACLAGGAAAQPQGPQALYLRSVAATCANCHGTDGRAVSGSAVPAIAGVPRDHLLAQLRAFRDGSRPATVMHQLAKGYSDAQLEAIATYFAAQQR